MLSRTMVVLVGLTLGGLATAQREDSTILHAFGGGAGSRGGTAVAIVGDVDRDGHADIALGAPLTDTTSGGTDAGRVTVHSGRDGSVLYTFDGPFGGRRLGTSVAAAGDVNGDGYPDIVAGGFGGGNGLVIVYSGLTGGTLVTLQEFAGWGLGFSVASAGDVDGDGKDEIVAGLPFFDTSSLTNCGQVRVWKIAPTILLQSFTGNVANQQLGYAVDGAGDVNGDGLDEVVAGAPFYNLGFPNANIGRVQVLSVASPGAPLLDYIPNVGSVIHYNCGFAVAGVGDVDGDGRGDIAVGCPGFRASSAATPDGRVQVFSAASTAVLATFTGFAGSGERLGAALAALGDVGDGNGARGLAIGSPSYVRNGLTVGRVQVLALPGSIPLFSYVGTQATAGFASAVGGAGDVNGDGRNDAIVGVPTWNAGSGPLFAIDAGQALVFSPAGDFRRHSIPSGLAVVDPGNVVAVLGDLDLDGFDDYVVGSPFPNSGGHGQVRVYSGQVGTLLYTLTRPGSGLDRFGWSVADAGDFDGDGTRDFIVGAPDAPGVGATDGVAFVYSGANGAELAMLTGGSCATDFGHSVAGLGDVNGDGNADVIVGDPRYDCVSFFDFGRVTLFSGPSGAVIGTINGSGIDARMGTAVVGLGDLNGDGRDDFAIGSSGFGVPVSGNDAGRAEIRLGAIAPPFPTLFSVDGAPGELLGHALANAGDVDGDGVDDLVVGGPGYSSATILGSIANRGRVRVFSGANQSTLLTRFGERSGDQLGWSVSGAGDYDGDGRADVILGAPFGDGSTATDNGYAWVVSGSDGRLLSRFEGDALGNGANLGRSVAGGGRISPDHRDDVLVSGIDMLSPGEARLAMVFSLGDLVGASLYGRGTRGCDGPVRLGTSHTPRVGNADFAIVCRHAPPNGFGDFAVTFPGAQSPSGLDLAGIGLLFHVDVLASPPIATFQMAADATGFASLAAPIPFVPSLAGFGLSMQGFWYWPQACVGPVFSLSSTNGLDLTIRP